jgi:ribonuclease HI
MITVRGIMSMENLREFFQQGELPWPYTGYKCIRARSPRECYLCGLPIKSGELYFRDVRGGMCIKHVDVEEIRSYRERLKRAESIIIIGTDASGPGGERWAFVVYRDRKGKRHEIHRCRGFNEGLRGPTPAEGIAVIKALEWAIEATKEGIISPDEFIQVDSDNYAVSVKLEQKGRNWDRYSEIWKKLEKLCDSLKERLIVKFDPEANREADLYAQKMPGDRD